MIMLETPDWVGIISYDFTSFQDFTIIGIVTFNAYVCKTSFQLFVI